MAQGVFVFKAVNVAYSEKTNVCCFQVYHLDLIPVIWYDFLGQEFPISFVDRFCKLVANEEHLSADVYLQHFPTSISHPTQNKAFINVPEVHLQV